MNNLVVEILNNFDLDSLKENLQNFIQLHNDDFINCDKFKTQGQLSIQHRFSTKEDLHLDGVGKAINYPDFNLTDFCILNTFFSGSVIEEIINYYNLYRSRIMMISPKSCYTIHTDYEKRLHIPIITNNDCYMLFPKHNQMFNLKENKIYITDTREYHTAINCSWQERIHFVGCLTE